MYPPTPPLEQILTPNTAPNQTLDDLTHGGGRGGGGGGVGTFGQYLDAVSRYFKSKSSLSYNAPCKTNATEYFHAHQCRLSQFTVAYCKLLWRLPSADALHIHQWCPGWFLYGSKQ